ncbi:MAG: DUF1822 family protein [Chamaesiphon sp.]|nr:DUF1822 family protein [Chamaesiphon sp.]
MFATPGLYLAIPPDSQARFWQKSARDYSIAGNRWQAALNQACLDGLLPWLQAERDPTAQVWAKAASRASFWEVVNGAAIDLHDRRLVLIPTTAIDFGELRVPQEWIDLPSWAGDYYLSIYVNLDDSEIQVLGYTTHQQLKQQGQYDPLDRTYSYDGDDLIPDLNVLWLARQLCPTQVHRAAIAALPQIRLEQAENLLARLGTPALLRPRLAVSFPLWGGLMEHSGWRQQLYRDRLGLPEQWSMAKWFQSEISELGQQLGWAMMRMEPNLVLARGEYSSTTKILLRQLTIAGQAYELRIFPTGANLWRFELHCTTNSQIARGVKLRLLTADLLPFANNEDLALTATDRLYLDVHVSPGDGLVWEIEPQPDRFDREILRF